MTRILVTGASGFVGRALVTELAGLGYSVRAAMRQPADVFPRNVEVVAVSDLTRPVEWRALLKGIETVVHLAGIAHVGPEIAEDLYDRVNRLATAELAKAAQAIGVRHLVFISSIRAQSGPSSADILRETDAPQPTDAYGRSKLAAEDAVRAAGVPFTILRPVLIVGYEVHRFQLRDEVIKLAGATNIFGSETSNSGYPEVSDERIIAANPAVIILTEDPAYGGDPQMVGKRPGWADLAAVKNGKIYALNPDLIQRPGPRLVDALEQVAKLLHPEVFS
jgi:nucleoside-diphosphate-sugar epimerase